jgi:tetratricopeptide (TPR) repeat protein
MRPAFALTAAAFAGLVATASPAWAAGDTEPSKPTCKRGEVYDQQRKACVQAQSGMVDDGSLADYAYLLAKDERYDEALAVLDLLQNPNTAEALNYRGYATRKLGRVEEGIGFYKQAVALDPDDTLVREYLGEAYVTQGRLEMAKTELAEIEKRCGTTCEPYQDLAEAIQAAGG